MEVKSNTISKRYAGYLQISLDKNKIVTKLGTFLIIISIAAAALFFVSKSFSGNGRSKDMFIAEFRTDVNKLWEASRIIEMSRARNPEIKEFGTTGQLLGEGEVDQRLKNALISIADSDGDKKLSDSEFKALGLMRLDKKLYSEELKRLQYMNLSTDNNLEHYIIVTEGKYSGTILYNGVLDFVDSNSRRYFGVELFEQQGGF